MASALIVVAGLEGSGLGRRHRVRSHLRFRLRVRERTEFRRHAARNRRSFAAGLEAREVWTISPRKWTAEPDARFDRRVVHDIDSAFIIRRSLTEPREVAEI